MKKVFLEYARVLGKGGVENPLTEIQRFVSDSFRIPFAKVVAFDFKLSNEIIEKIDFFCKERAKGVPYAYIVGFTEFFGRKFLVNKHVLIPRPETEHIVEFVLDRVSKDFKGTILDCCTGSGNIAVTLAAELRNSFVVASDISQNALKLALRNASLHNAEIFPICCDKVKCFGEKSFDLITANPPYISIKERVSLEREVLNEPHIALFGGDKGTEFIEEMIIQGLRVLKTGGLLVFEIGYNQKEAISDFLKETGIEKFYFLKDLNGHYRIGVIENA